MMKQKNIIYIVVDAFCYNNLQNKVGKKEVTPFLNQLMSKSTCFTEMYAQAPYTEAAQVALLSGENTLDSGGYLFGNATIKTPMFQKYQSKGYKTLFSYSPYVYSKGYLRNVDKYYYTRLYNIEVLFSYRLNYFSKKSKERNLTSNEYKVCILLLEEAFATWMLQCQQLLGELEETKMIKDSCDKKNICEILEDLECENSRFNKNPKKYINILFEEGDEHILHKLCSIYNSCRRLPLQRKKLEQYTNKLKEYQKKYTRIAKKQLVDLNYVFGMLWRNINGLEDCKRTLKAYLNLYSNRYLESYLGSINENTKVEVSMKTMFDTFEQDIIEYDKSNQNYFAYMHVQDFHLPSVFHTYDTEDGELIEEEFDIAFKLLEEMDNSFRGNIIAALSARFCDLKLEKFFENLQKKLENEFLFVVTADHGYPCYECPPRPIIYNQTYTEAFHVPFIVYDSLNKKKKVFKQITSVMDSIVVLQKMSGINNLDIEERGYVLCEYAGPGCPVIDEKPIWYTLISKDYRISVECMLENIIGYDCIKEIYNLKNDPLQKKNLIKKYKNTHIMDDYLTIFNERHDELRKIYGGGYYAKILLKI